MCSALYFFTCLKTFAWPLRLTAEQPKLFKRVPIQFRCQTSNADRCFDRREPWGSKNLVAFRIEIQTRTVSWPASQLDQNCGGEQETANEIG